MAKRAKESAEEALLLFAKNLARKTIRRCPTHIELSDLEGAAILGYFEAKKKADLEKNFVSYAKTKIRCAIVDEIRRYDWAKSWMRRDAKALLKKKAELEGKDGEPIKACELSKAFGMTVDEFYQRLEPLEAFKMLSLSSEAVKEAEDEYQVEESLLFKNTIKMVPLALKKVSPKLRKVLRLYFFKGKTLVEIGQTLGLTESRASQLKKMALMEIKEKLSKDLTRWVSG